MPPTTDQTSDTVDLDRLDLSQRLRPAHPGHVATLVAVLEICPPITVHRTTLRLVDGHMRVDAARVLGWTSLPVAWVEGDDVRMLELATTMNSRHGMPLTHTERREAASRLLGLAPAWSNRRIAAAAGVSESSVRRLRCPGASPTHLDTRCGADGKTYPTDAEPVRREARDMLAADPEISDRAVARRTGLSPTTVGRLRRDLESPEGQPSGLPATAPREHVRKRSVLARLWEWLRRRLWDGPLAR